MSGPRAILVICGLNREAAVAAGPGIVTVAGGGSRASLEERLAGLGCEQIRAVVSFGLAGALAPDLAVGDVVVPSAWFGPAGREPVTLSWPGLARLSRSGGERSAGRDGRDRSGQHTGPRRALTLVGVDQPVLTRAEKADLARRAGADLVDMESHVAGVWAQRQRLPFGILRVVSDAAGRALPAIAGIAMRPDGSLDILGVLAALARDPRQLPGLIATARDAGRAFRVLRRVRGLLGPRLGLDL